eukprot:gene15972-20164_t
MWCQTGWRGAQRCRPFGNEIGWVRTDDLVIVSVSKGSPAEEAGVEPGWRMRHAAARPHAARNKRGRG